MLADDDVSCIIIDAVDVAVDGIMMVAAEVSAVIVSQIIGTAFNRKKCFNGAIKVRPRIGGLND